MREVIKSQLSLGQVAIENIKIDHRSRDDTPRILLGLQYIYCDEKIRRQVFRVLEEILPQNKQGKRVSAKHGRPGMSQWEALVLGMLRLCLNADYDRLLDLANNHRLIRQMLECTDNGVTNSCKTYSLQSLRDNLRLLTPAHLDRINRIIVRAGHGLLGYAPDQKLSARCDSFVLKTDVEYPTDTGMLYHSAKIVTNMCMHIGQDLGLTGWRQGRHLTCVLKRILRKIGKILRSQPQKEELKAQKEERLFEQVRHYLARARSCLERAEETVLQYEALPAKECLIDLTELKTRMGDMRLLSDQIERRILKKETIPQPEKIFSIFQRHTEWISKGKAGTPVELGVRICVMEDQAQFLLHHQVMAKLTDEKVAVTMVKESKERFPGLSAVSMDKGFHSKDNQRELGEMLDHLVLPKKGKLSAADKERESDPEFIRLRHDRSAVESAINSLQVHGLDICRDHGLDGLQRYAAMAIVAHNLHRIGAILRQQKLDKEKRTIKKAA